MALIPKEIINLTSIIKDYKGMAPAEFMQKYHKNIIRATKKHEETGQSRELLCDVSKFDSKSDIEAEIKNFCDVINAENKLYKARVRAVHRELKKGAIKATEEGAVEKAKKVADEAVIHTQKIDNDIALAMKNALQTQNNSIDEGPKGYSMIDIKGVLSNPDIVKHMSAGSGSTFLLLGSSKSGKSTLMVKLGIMWKQLYPSTIIILISGTQKKDGGIYESLKKVVGNDIIVTDKIKESIKLAGEIQKETSAAKPMLFLIDDIVTEKENKAIMELFLTYRNYNISTIMAMQTCKLFNKNNRGNVNYVLAGRLANSEIIEDCFKCFLSGIYSGTTKVQVKDERGNPQMLPQFVVDYKRDTTDYKKLFIDQINDKIYTLV